VIFFIPSILIVVGTIVSIFGKNYLILSLIFMKSISIVPISGKNYLILSLIFMKSISIVPISGKNYLILSLRTLQPERGAAFG